MARAVIEYHERTGHGDLSEAISEARRAAELWPDSPEPLLWEGVAQALAGRDAKARRYLAAFLVHEGHRPAGLEQRARDYLAQVGTSDGR